MSAVSLSFTQRLYDLRFAFPISYKTHNLIPHNQGETYYRTIQKANDNLALQLELSFSTAPFQAVSHQNFLQLLSKRRWLCSVLWYPRILSSTFPFTKKEQHKAEAEAMSP